jgi:hypothetical protein
MPLAVTAAKFDFVKVAALYPSLFKFMSLVCSTSLNY